MDSIFSDSQSDTPVEVAKAQTPVRQITVLIPNTVGALSQVVKALHDSQVEVLGISLQDAAEATRVRMILSDPIHGEQALIQLGYSVIQHEVIVLQLTDVAQGFSKVLCALLEGELNLQHCYSLMIHDQLHGYLALLIEDISIGAECLQKAGFKLLSQDELSR